MKKTLYTKLLLLATLSGSAQFESITFENIPHPEVLEFNTFEPAIEVSSDGTIYYGGLEGIYWTTDMGQNWTQGAFETGTLNNHCAALELMPSSGNLYAGNDYNGGFGMSSDGGQTFEIFTTTYCHSIFVDDGFVFAGLSTVLRKFPDGDYNAGYTVLAAGKVRRVNKGMNGELYAVLDDEIYESVDEGETWELVYSTDEEVYYVLPLSNDQLLFGEQFLGVGSTNNSFESPVFISGSSGLDAVRCGANDLVVIRGTTAYSFSSDNGQTIDVPFTGEMNTMIGDAIPPIIDPEGIIDQIDVHNGNVYVAGNNAIAIISKSASNSVHTMDDEKSVVVYPNPCEVGSMVRLDQTFDQVSVLNSCGREIEHYQNTNEINTSNLPAGLYCLHLKRGNLNQMTRLVVR